MPYVYRQAKQQNPREAYNLRHLHGKKLRIFSLSEQIALSRQGPPPKFNSSRLIYIQGLTLYKSTGIVLKSHFFHINYDAYHFCSIRKRACYASHQGSRIVWYWESLFLRSVRKKGFRLRIMNTTIAASLVQMGFPLYNFRYTQHSKEGLEKLLEWPCIVPETQEFMAWLENALKYHMETHSKFFDSNFLNDQDNLQESQEDLEDILNDIHDLETRCNTSARQNEIAQQLINKAKSKEIRARSTRLKLASEFEGKYAEFDEHKAKIAETYGRF